jgi:hypothetical protein
MPDVFVMECTGDDIFIVFDGVRIAKRGDDKTWVPLEPGWRVLDGPNLESFVVEYDGVLIH